jgi:protein-tyrosine-phosphatase
MKVVILDLDGVNNGPVVKALLAQKFPGNEFAVFSSSEKTKGRKTTRKVKKAAKAALGLDIEALIAEPITAEAIAGADRIVYENENNIKLVVRRLGKEALNGKTMLKLDVKSGHAVKPAETEAFMQELASKVSAVQL